MFARNHSDTTTDRDTRGPSLARGPAWITGLVLSIAGLALFFKSPGTPLGTGNFPDGFADGQTFLGFETNAWTAWGTTAAGILVLIGAAQHALAKTMSLITGIALAAAAILFAIDGDDVLGLAAANVWTALAWAIAAGILLVTALLPRMHRHEADDRHTDTIATRDRDRGAYAGQTSMTDRTAAGTRARTSDATIADTADRDQPATTAGGSMRSEPLRRTYGQGSQADRERELEEARRAQAEEAARRR